MLDFWKKLQANIKVKKKKKKRKKAQAHKLYLKFKLVKLFNLKLNKGWSQKICIEGTNIHNQKN